jgi:hypothetical protein
LDESLELENVRLDWVVGGCVDVQLELPTWVEKALGYGHALLAQRLV